METAPLISLDVVADRSLVKDIVRGILSTIFFHRFSPSIKPTTIDLLDITLPSVNAPELDVLIEEKTTTLIRSIEDSSTSSIGNNANVGQLSVTFYEKRPRKAWFSTKQEEEICWEQWIVKVTLVKPKSDFERASIRKLMEKKLQNAVLQIIAHTTSKKNHIPPIFSNESPFPYRIDIKQKRRDLDRPYGYLLSRKDTWSMMNNEYTKNEARKSL